MDLSRPAHSIKALKRNILGCVGISPVHETLVGTVEGLSLAQREQWFRKLAALAGQAVDHCRIRHSALALLTRIKRSRFLRRHHLFI